jgi:hypothetical protein
MSPEDLSQFEPSDEFEQALAEAEQSLIMLREDYTIFREQQPLAMPSESLKTGLASLHEKIEDLKVYLKFLAFSWREAKEPFWQAVRFGGLGILLGWFLKSFAG